MLAYDLSIHQQQHKIENNQLHCISAYRHYKNSCKQSPGINEEAIKWMRSVWDDRKAGGYQFIGGLLIDEMTIQVTTDFEYNM